MSIPRSPRWSAVGRITCLVLATTFLTGCIIEPVRVRPPEHYYYR